MLNQSYRIKTLLNAPIKNLGASLTGHKACAGGLLNKTISAFDIQSFDFESTFKVFNSVSNTTSRPERKLQQIFSNTCTLNKSFRHKTFMTAQPVRYYSTSQIEGEKTLKRNELPEAVQRLVDNAPSTGYHGDNINEYLKQGDYDKRQFAYFVANSSRFIVAAGVRLLILRFLYSWSAAADVLAVAKIEVDVSNVPKGKTITVTWRGKPVFIKHRTEDEIKSINSMDLSTLKDPQSDAERTKDENWSVLLAICTHLGCVPVTDAGIMNAFFCPCHGSHYDASGRIVKGPAPLNLEVPKHQFINESTILLG
nr:unnamed protein product [Naegleria fowleri]